MIGRARCLAGLDIGSTATTAVLVEAGPGWESDSGQVRVLGVGVAHTEGVRNRNVTHIEAASRSSRR